ncbi:MAG: hypothetical protein Q8N99_06645 [Nanoarchaeota archaeon]|nr:hypothetical protein [Nanoarchaeota archaeon]
MGKKVIFILVFAILLIDLIYALENFTINVNSPEDNIYNSRKVFIDISSDTTLDSISFISQNDKILTQRNLCKHCKKYYGSKTFDEGHQLISLFATKHLTTIDYNVSFFIDSAKPKIAIISPRQKSFSNGYNFSLQLIEKNPKSLSINYGNYVKGFVYRNIDITNECENIDNSFLCEFNLFLDDYDSDSIFYDYELVDIAGNKVKTKPIQVEVDTKKPLLLNPDSFYSYSDSYIDFILDIDENNLKSIKYLDYGDEEPIYKQLCISLSKSVCKKRVPTRASTHDVSITIIDRAGNIKEALLKK